MDELVENGGFTAFLAVVRNNGISAAAAELHLSQSTVSHRVLALEHTLGVPLLRRGRGTRGVQLTQAGTRLLPLAQAREELDRRIMAVSTGRSSIAIGSPGTAADLVATAIQNLSATVDRLRLRLTIANPEQLMPAIHRHVLDVAVTPAPNTSDALSSEIIGTEPYCVLTVRDLPSSSGSRVSVKDLPAESEVRIRWVGLDGWHERHWPGDRWLAELDSIALLPVLPAWANAWCLVPRSTATNFARRFGFHVLQLWEPAPVRTLYWTMRQDEARDILPEISQLKLAVASAFST